MRTVSDLRTSDYAEPRNTRLPAPTLAARPRDAGGVLHSTRPAESARHRPPIDSTAEGHGWLVYT